ncbi:cytochrome c oxidase subunit II [Polyangium aurulentum]|uniref:cytochrome c oxidase subunit II n=1 Tax=Polyangium aurulentum TaxID=2567896 RepID=UPI0010AEE00A|nr:cytochrome c oxidase subunit II [Polyangium aurulentum]UQA57807.1 cytochrome c oxidase subunit II [Polyangium aurulentum]
MKDPIELGSFWLPRQSSTIAKEIDFAWDVVLWVDILLFIGLMGAMFYFMYRYRRRSEKDKVSLINHNMRLEVTWTIIPTILVLALFAIGLKGYVMSSVAPAEALEIRTTAEMYMWTFTYPDGTVSVNELVVPKGRPVKLVMSSKDVLHSFFVPEFRVKQDVVPGTYTTLWFEPTETRETVLFCTEYCGVGHSDMLAQVKVLEETDFKKWIEMGGTLEKLPPAELGKKLFASRSCATCHSTDGTRIQGPTFKGLFGRTEQIADGSSVKVDENYIRESLLEPTKKVVQGYPAVMPTYKGLLKDQDIDALIAYIKTLQ